eukprot:758524-Hanusia_phi.AAC.5
MYLEDAEGGKEELEDVEKKDECNGVKHESIHNHSRNNPKDLEMSTHQNRTKKRSRSTPCL